MTTAEKLDKVFAPKGENKYGTVDGIQKHPAFFELTTKQQQWVVEYLSTGDRIAATHKVYPTTAKPTNTKHHYDEERASINMRVAGIRTLIAAFHGQEPVELPITRTELALQLSRAIRSIDVEDQRFPKLCQYLMMLNGWYKASAMKDAFHDNIRKARKEARNDRLKTQAQVVSESIADIEKALRVKEEK